ncbi:MAG: carboxymuconolactone decarboxylase family protein [Thermoanaerobaculia bacterium]
MSEKAAAIQIVRRSEADRTLAEAYRRVAGPDRDPANILAVSSLNPRSMEDHARLYRGLMFGTSPLSRTERELVATVVSRTNGCHY